MMTQNRNNNGFTLIEISIVLIIVGIFLAAIITPYKIYTAEKARSTTLSNMALVSDAITNFLAQNGRYPCPAPLTAGPGDPLYGVETACDPDDPDYPTYNFGQCVDGLCFEVSEKGTVDIDPDPNETTMADAVVRRGSIPFRSLGLAELETIDGYNARIQYTVSENLTKVETFVNSSGGISLVDENGNNLIDPPNSVHYLVFSTGKDKNGAYNRQGSLINPCDTSRLDGENCNTGITGDARKAIYVSSEFNDSGNANHFDDIMKQDSTRETPLWQVSGSGGFHVRDLLGDGDGVVAIANSSPQEQLDVGVEILVADDESNAFGKSKFTEICDRRGENCFSLDEFGGEHENFKCGGATPYAIGFAEGQIKCSSLPSETRCPSGTKLRGIESDGTLNCETMVGCPSKNDNICGNTHSIAPKVYTTPWNNPANYVTLEDGINRVREWRCTSSGRWSLSRSSGSCECTPGSRTRTVTCNQYKPTGYWTGTVEIISETECNPGPSTSTRTEGAESCECVPQTNSWNYSCPTGYTGNYTRSREWSCNSATSGSWSGFTDDRDTQCVCDSSATQTRNFSCPAGFDDPSGRITRERSFNCTTDSWGDWEEVSDTCSCNGRTETVLEGCGAGLEGNIRKQRQYNCTTQSWGPWVSQENCGALSHFWRGKSAARGPFGSRVGPYVGDTCFNPGQKKSCSSPTSTGGYMHYQVCECE